jgi:GNAT superfamily N-acetyltransferase
MSSRAAAIAWRHAQHASVCDRADAWEHGTAVFAGVVADFWSYNSVRVEGPDSGLSAADVLAAADRIQAGLPHRHVEVEDEAAGARVRPGLTARGWVVERNAWMALDGPGNATAPAVEVTEVPFARTRALRDEWAGQWPGGPAERERFMAAEELVAARRGTRALAAWGGGGEPIGFATFSAAAGSAEVEQVYVRPARRGAGAGATLVAAAVAAAAARTTFIVADDEGDPKRLYARLGFGPVWVQHVFTRRPPAA